MNREDVRELHYITPISNVGSILQAGILSHGRAAKLRPESIADSQVQKRRSSKTVPGTRRQLHSYVNLYFHARNPMMFRRKRLHSKLCVLRVSTDVLDLPGVVLTDENASSDYVRFLPAPSGLNFLDEEMVFARDWRDDDRIQYFRKKSAKCAEVLVPDRVDPDAILGAYVSCKVGQRALTNAAPSLPISLEPDLFFAD